MNQRQRFEAFVSVETTLPLGRVHSNPNADYVCDDTSIAWFAWQEAERQTVERCAQICESSSHRDDDMGAIFARNIRALEGQDD